jgi:hypothetical protein
MDDKGSLGPSGALVGELLVRYSDDAVLARGCVSLLRMLAPHPGNLPSLLPAVPCVLSALQQHREDMQVCK